MQEKLTEYMTEIYEEQESRVSNLKFSIFDFQISIAVHGFYDRVIQKLIAGINEQLYYNRDEHWDNESLERERNLEKLRDELKGVKEEELEPLLEAIHDIIVEYDEDLEIEIEHSVITRKVYKTAE